MSRNVPRTFRELFSSSQFSSVEIPIIQRDFAQGRSTALEVRTQFLDALYQALSLPADSPDLPLDLDFIYGSMEGSTRETFCLLDGQQRLTTLFLLHWYLACIDGKSESFRGYICREKHSRFTYKVRPSSQDFFDELVCSTINLSSLLSSDQETERKLSSTIIDSAWFYLSWQQDPTIRSALRMLDAIHDRFKDTQGFYDQLVASENPYITFQFLNLRDFGLSDDLYIKMNARGKPLTLFEAFKARLEQLIDKLLPDDSCDLKGRTVSLREYFSFKIDSSWSDLLWHYHDGNKYFVDQQFMNLVRAVAMVIYPQEHTNTEPTLVNRVVDDLNEFDGEYSFYKYLENDCLTPKFVRSLISVMDALSGSGDGVVIYLKDNVYYDENDVFRRILQGGRRRVTQSEWVQFYGFCIYLIKHQPTPNSPEFYDWMRVISNLATNTIYYHTGDFIRALVGVHDLIDALGSESVIDYIANTELSKIGFNRQQIQEERLKAQLMRRNDAWGSCLLEAEKHGYFRGQVEFILQFSGTLDRWSEVKQSDWNDVDDGKYRLNFISYYEKANSVFGNEGLRKFDEFLWERALLATGDYLLSKNSNKSFLIDRDRDISWKRLLRGGERRGDVDEARRLLVKQLLDQVNELHIKESLQGVIDKFLKGKPPANVNEWRRKFVECPEAIQYCGKRQLRIAEGGKVYLLSKIRTSSYHAELSTFHLKEILLESKSRRGDLNPFTDIYYWSECDEYNEPRVSLSWQDKRLEISHESYKYALKFFGQNKEMPKDLASALIEKLSFETQWDNSLVLKVSPLEIEQSLNQLVLILRAFDEAAPKS